MYELSKFKLGNALFIDIETTRATKDLQIDSPEFEAWKYDRQKDGKYSNEELIELYVNRAALYPEFGKITCISVGRITEDNLFPMKSYYGPDEKTILEHFFKDLHLITAKKPSAFFAGHAILDFDLPYILKRSIINRVPYHILVDNSGLKPWEVNVLDTKPLWKTTSFSATSLISMAVALGIASPKDDISGAEAAQLGWSDDVEQLKRIAIYCEKDVFTVAQVIHRLAGLEPLTLISSFNGEDLPEETPTEVDVITYIYEGGLYTDEIKQKLIDYIIPLPDEDKAKVYDILSAATSSAKGSKTHMQKTDVTKLKKEIITLIKKSKK